MPIVLGVDLGTTKITSLAVDANTGAILAVATAANEANITSETDRGRGRSEWKAEQILATACRCLAEVASKLDSQVAQVIGLGITGQQHGMVLVDAALHPLTPLINWQDRRALDPIPHRDVTWLEAARSAIGSEFQLGRSIHGHCQSGCDQLCQVQNQRRCLA
jgi:sugar (pentulose or hexulose) kinase